MGIEMVSAFLFYKEVLLTNFRFIPSIGHTIVNGNRKLVQYRDMKPISVQNLPEALRSISGTGPPAYLLLIRFQLCVLCVA